MRRLIVIVELEADTEGTLGNNEKDIETAIVEAVSQVACVNKVNGVSFAIHHTR